MDRWKQTLVDSQFLLSWQHHCRILNNGGSEKDTRQELGKQVMQFLGRPKNIWKNKWLGVQMKICLYEYS